MSVRQRAAAVAETLAALAVVAWVGGHAALGAFAARIAFRDLPRALAASTMTTVFRSFDGVIIAAALLLLVAAAARALLLGLDGGANKAALGAALGLCAVGVLELAYVHPTIESMFAAGRTLEPAFASLHRLSERCGHLEVMLAALLLGAQAWSRGEGARAG